MLSFVSFYALVYSVLLFPVLSQSSPANTSSEHSSPNTHNHVVQQDFDHHPPFPVLEIGLQHILAQIGANATEAGNESMSGNTHHHIEPVQKIPVQVQDVVDQCGPDVPCIDDSCCNSEGKCGYTPYNCESTASTACISNCGSRAMCGVNSRNSAERCPLNLCCSYFGYCGYSEIHCGNPNGMAPCQNGYGSCQTVTIPSCVGGSSASGGRKVAYYQAGNLLYRKCHRMSPSDIVPRDLTHLIFAFVFINPNTFEVEPENDPHDRALYQQFTALKMATTQTWLSIGGYGFSDPGDTFTTWSELCADKGRRTTFITSLINFMTTWGFQGVDLDWEYPVESNRGGRPIDTSNFNILVQEMRAAFGSRFGISVALPADFSYIQHFDIATLSQSIDFFNFMTYDLHGPWEASILGASLKAPSSISDINKALLPLWYAGVPPSKINIGVSMYGRSYTLQDPNCAVLGCPYTGPGNPGICTDSPGLLSLWEVALLRQDKGLGVKYLPDVGMEQVSFDDQYVVFDASLTVDRKLQWADGLCLGGIVFWGADLYSSWGSGRTPLTLSVDSTCGPSKSTTCTTCPSDSCCSRAGFCGTTPLHCEASNGCQPAFGICTAVWMGNVVRALGRRVWVANLEIVVRVMVGVEGRKIIVRRLEGAKKVGELVLVDYLSAERKN
ncbi:hypothetical protein VTL71DRAFT_16512 [Oculimacula yallundae]|uniref:chitinase n=1 Tax=Oculimacula yallundae TaxID=86028 RepID=A0ABR4CEM6_9HELO